jgi:PAS domain S-box-containing protein
MNRLLRVLIVEDSEDDTLLVVREFKQAGYEVSFERVQTEAAMEDALSKEKWDIVISDYVLPDFSGLAALRLLQRKGIDLPFIIVSGKISEDAAVEAIKAGAHDYLMKNNLKRLAVAVEQEMREAESRRKLKKAEEALRESEEKFRIIFDHANDGILLADAETKQFYTGNNTACQMLGYSLDEVNKLGVTDIHPKEELPYVLGQFERQVRREIALAEDLPVKRKDGSVFYADVNTSLVTLSGKPYLLGVFRDITGRKKAEDELRKNIQLLNDTGEMAKVGSWELDLATREVSWTEEVARIHGVSPRYKMSLEEAINFYAPESIPVLEATLKKTIETGEPYDLESLFIPSGSKDKIWVRSLGRAIYSSGKIVKLTGTFQNIDKYKRAADALKKSEEKYRLLAQNINQGIYSTFNGMFISVNKAMHDMFRYSEEEFKQIPAWNLAVPESREKIKKEFFEKIDRKSVV